MIEENVALDQAEIAAHQFTEPLKPPAKPPSALKRAIVAAVSGKVWFRVGWTCGCVVDVLETAEAEMLLRGLISDSLDIYQLQGNASASAGTHSKPGAYDVGQYSDQQIDVQRLSGGDGQHRTTAQGFSMDHCHGFAQGCPHGSDALLGQKRDWNNGKNGLASEGPIQGRWPTKDWQTAVAERKRIIMALKQDIVNETIAGIRGLIPTPAQIWGYAVNVSNNPKKSVNWPTAHILSWMARNQGGSVNPAIKAILAAQAAQNKKIDQLTALVNGLVKK